MGKKDENIRQYIATSHHFIRSMNGIMAYNFLFKFKISGAISDTIFRKHYQNANDLNFYLTEWMKVNGFLVNIEQNIMKRKKEEKQQRQSYIDSMCSSDDNMNVKAILSDINALFQAG